MPPRAGPFGRRGFFRAFSAHFCVTLEHLFFKRQNVEEKSAENGHRNGRKNGHKNLRTKNLRKNGRKNLRTKNGRKMGAKICAPKICAKTGLNIPFVWKMEAKKKHKKNLRQTCAKHQPQILRIIFCNDPFPNDPINELLKKKNNEPHFCGPKWTVWDPLLTQKSPRKSLCGSLLKFLRPFPGNEAHKLFVAEGPKWGVFGWGEQEVYVEKGYQKRLSFQIVVGTNLRPK